MNTRKRIGIGGCGSVVVVAFLITPGWAVPEQMRIIKEMEGAQKKEEADAPVVEVPQVPYKAGGLREPFNPVPRSESDASPQLDGTQSPSETVVSPPALTISGLMWGGSIPQAIINGKVLRVGDSVVDATIMQIEQDGILVSYKGKLFTIRSPAAVSSSASKLTSQGGT